MGKVLGVLAVGAAGVALGACGGDTTTVVNNETTVTKPTKPTGTTTTTTTTTPPSPSTESRAAARDCGGAAGRQANIYEIEAASTKCEYARNIAESWSTTCLGGRAECAIGDYACVSTVGGNASFEVTCRATVEDGEVRFVVFPN